MKIEKLESGGVHMTVTHSCGHAETYFYGAEKFAVGDLKRQESKPCIGCFNSEQLRLSERKT